MERRTIGEFEVSVLGLGTSRLASMGSGRSRSDARALLASAHDCGINVLDTADTYGSTAAERWIGDLTFSDADSWVVVTKTGLPTVDLPGPFRVLNQPAKKVKQRVRGYGFAIDPRRLRRNIERSLRRLRRDRIEIYLMHLPPERIGEDEEVLAILREAQRSGLIAEFGVSSDSLRTIRNAHEGWGSLCAESAVNPRSEAGSMIGALADIQVIANHVMGSLTDEVSLPPAQAETGDRATLSKHQRLLRHAAAVPGVRVVLTGTSSIAHLRQNVAAFDTRVSEADLLV